jgi:5-methylcytosine-specific restriction endonuclease McrA
MRKDGESAVKKKEEYCVDVFTEHRLKWFDEYRSARRRSQFGSYTTLFADSRKDVRRIMIRARLLGIKTRCYRREFDRDEDCRRKFMAANRPPYRCRYCGKIITPGEMEVDHLIPVSRAKSSASVRRKLKRNGMDGVNDVKNLVPACRKCNRKKGDRMGIWYIRGKLGASEKYWEIRKKVHAVFVIVLIGLILFAIRFIMSSISGPIV